ncbi:tyrosine-type recombinase/integrase [Haloarcula sp. Atlit-7R]|uniref:tyrosine-type recombinase/integrase n=1 Tax=Haloarcula sp. Atlit-7R TaxID=2282125 RepID=UPI001314D38F|nr:tyrosine-type recombinase/integrase [Haloarcula sp. Atlit-7R]
MGQRRSSLSDVLTKEQYRNLLQTAAAIDDREESITIFYFLIVLGRAGLRIGEAIHMTQEWLDEERGMIVIPPHVDCTCGMCRHYARNLAEDNENLSFEEALDRYWMVKDESDRDVAVENDRAIEIIKLYFEEVPYDTISYSTVLRRLKKVAELTDGVNPAHVYGHMLRATAATHYAWAGMRPPALDQKHGWQDEKTKERYLKKKGRWSMLDARRIRGKTDTDEFTLRQSPPTYTDLRPSSPAQRIHVETWTPESNVNTHPRYVDDEEWMQEEISEYSASFSIITLAKAYWRFADQAIDRIFPPLEELYSEYVGVPLRGWAEGSQLRTAGVFLAHLFVGALMLAVALARIGVYIDPIAGEIHMTRIGVLSILSALAFHTMSMENLWEQALQDITGNEEIGELLTVYPSKWSLR